MLVSPMVTQVWMAMATEFPVTASAHTRHVAAHGGTQQAIYGSPLNRGLRGGGGLMHKAIYLNVLLHVESTKNSPLDSKAALSEVEQLIRAIHANPGLSIEVKRVRFENMANL